MVQHSIFWRESNICQSREKSRFTLIKKGHLSEIDLLQMTKVRKDNRKTFLRKIALKETEIDTPLEKVVKTPATPW